MKINLEIRDAAHANWVRSCQEQVQEALSGTRAIMLRIDPAGTSSTNPDLRRWWLQTNYDLEYMVKELGEIADSLEGEEYEHEEEPMLDNFGAPGVPKPDAS